MTKKPPENLAPLLNEDFARTSRHLRFMKALIKIDDPGIELALLAVVERIAKASPASAAAAPPRSLITQALAHAAVCAVARRFTIGRDAKCCGPGR
jgi:hypothetical protein